MISKVGFNYLPKTANVMVKGKTNVSNPIETNENLPSPTGALLQKYNISFGAKNFKSENKINKMDVLEGNMTDESRELFHGARQLAKKYNNPDVNQVHVLRSSFDMLLDYIEQIDLGELAPDEEISFFTPGLYKSIFGKDIFKNNEIRTGLKKIIEDEIPNLDKILQRDQGDKTLQTKNKNMSFRQDLLNEIFSEYAQDGEAGLKGSALIPDSTIVEMSLYPLSDKIKKEVTMPFLQKVKMLTKLDDISTGKKIHLSFYDEKAKNVWKNLSVGTNMAVLYDKNLNQKHLINSFIHLLDESKTETNHFNKKNTEILVMNEYSDAEFLDELIKHARKQKDRNSIIIISDLYNTIKNSLDPETAAMITETTPLGFGVAVCSAIKNAPKNIKFVVLSEKDSFYRALEHMGESTRLFSEFGQLSLPVITMQEAKKIFKEEPAITAKLKKSFSKSAIEKCVEAANQLTGNYPEKALKVMELASSYYVDKNQIDVKDVENYIKEAKEIFKSTDNDSSIKLLFDTGVKLKDLVGVPSTKKEAKSIVDRIKDRSIGTKGFIIYSQDGSVGAGRKYTAKAIAGEAKVPYMELNAVDFGTKDVDLFGSGNLSPEASMKKFFSMVKAQAEANPNKSAVVFIENFEYFSAGEMVSEYHEKAMSQMIREMDKAKDLGLNVVIMGSTSNPGYVDGATSKSFKFIDLVEVESPGRNKDARIEILNYYIKKNGIQLAGKTPEAKAELVKSFAETTGYFSFIEIMTLLDKAKNVARERKHKEIDRADFVEAYLQLTTGRPSVKNIHEHEKKIVASHECGHAINTLVMLNLAKKQSVPWHMGDDVDFITLDPRGFYGGAVYTKDSDNEEWTFEKIFSDLVLDFGGNSCEKKFYNIDGSWGITMDMRMATRSASKAVSIMGMGKNFGKKSLSGAEILSEKDKDTMNEDINVMLKNAQNASDLITEIYSDFIQEFTDKYYSKVGTGECLIPGEVFKKEFADWKVKQSPEKQAEFEVCDNWLSDIIKKCKKGTIA